MRQTQSRQLISLYQSPELRLRYETRGRWFLGPQRACHPDHLEFCIFERGVEKYRVGNREGTTRAGFYDLVPPGVEHSSWTETKAVRECIIHLPTARLKEQAEEMGIRNGQWPADSSPVTEEIQSIVSALKWAVSQESEPSLQPVLVQSLTTSLAAVLLSRHFAGDTEPPPAEPFEVGIARAMEFIRANPALPISLAMLADIAGMDRFRFLRSFKQRFGTPPYAYLQRLRLENAAVLIQSTDLPLTDIAYDTGFSSSSRLSEAFRRQFGHSPSVWRRHNRSATSVKE